MGVKAVWLLKQANPVTISEETGTRRTPDLRPSGPPGWRMAMTVIRSGSVVSVVIGVCAKRCGKEFAAVLRDEMHV